MLFGGVHFSVLSMVVFLVPLGAVAGHLTRRTGSLLPAIWIHAAHNLGVLVIELRTVLDPADRDLATSQERPA